ncbi:MAG: flavin reductase family protein [Spongiibacteraceae bacterium]
MTFDRLQLRNAFGRFATGVCVITANPEGFDPLGMTINSFSSVSLDPPLLLWSLQNDSECVPAFNASKRFAVNILTSEQRELSKQYARKGEHTLQPDHFRIGATGLPILCDTLASFECELWQSYEGGDHVILVGKVLAVEHGGEAKPLLFFSGAYQDIQ